MKILELFSGTGILSEIARGRGHETFTIDLIEPADMNADIMMLSADDILDATGWSGIDMLWASPPCTGFSVAAIGKMWAKQGDTYTPKHPTAQLSLGLLEHTIHLIEALNPLIWYVENPRGMARRMECVADLRRATVTYCQYGEERMKPTDIWYYSPFWTPRPHCKNGDSCHIAAPRGSLTGTQGIKGAKLRAKLPEELCVEVIEAAEGFLSDE